MINVADYVNPEWADPEQLVEQYQNAEPFPHIVMENFIKEEFIGAVLDEFPDLKKSKSDAVEYNNEVEIKLASLGMGALSGAAFSLVSFLNSGVFLNYLQKLCSISETLMSDPYLVGGGYHEIKKGGLLKVHADFNKHPQINLDRRLNLLIYLNKSWEQEWGGELQLFDRDMGEPIVKVTPNFNKAVLFSTTSFAFHGHPDALTCPEDRSRKSLALYYFSLGRPKNEVFGSGRHSTVFKERKGEKLNVNTFSAKKLAQDLCPPILWKSARNLYKR